MPNWFHNIVYVTGDANAAGQLRSLMTTAQSKFDFHAILPMPDDLKHSESSTIAEDAWLLKYGDWTEITHGYGPGQFATRDEALAAARGVNDWGLFDYYKRPRSFDDIADAVQACVVKCGFPSWYEWACATWGTKWPAADAGWMGPARAAKRDAEQVAYFDTANGPPCAVIQSLSQRFPDVIIRLEYIEVINGIAGFISVQSGVVIAEKHEEKDPFDTGICTQHHLHHIDDGCVYIGHGRHADEHGPGLARSPWANPFVYCDCSPVEAARRYRLWLNGDAQVVKLLPPGEWPLPDVYSIADTFIGKTIVCDCGRVLDNGCPADVLVDIAFNREDDDESLDDDECDESLMEARTQRADFIAKSSQ